MTMTKPTTPEPASVSNADIDAVIVSEDCHVFPGTTVTVVILKLRNGFSVTGESACVSAAKFDADLGRKIARDNARDKIWALQGYLLRERLALGGAAAPFADPSATAAALRAFGISAATEPSSQLATGGDGSLADGAKALECAPGVVELEHHFSPVVQARLTHVVGALRGAWLAGPAQLWGQIHPIREAAGTELDQRVAVALRQNFFCFGQFLCGVEQLLLQAEKLGVVSEQSVLGLEKLCVHTGHLFSDQVPVANTQQAGADGFGCRD